MLRLLVLRDFMEDQFSFCLRDREEGLVQSGPTPMEKTKPGCILHPHLSLSMDAVQYLFDNLWREGFRPSKNLADIQGNDYLINHLEDMRAIVQDKLNVQLPNTGDRR